jgi:hypothetical protein
MSILSKIIIGVFGGKFRKEMRKIEKITEDDPDLQSTLTTMAKQKKELDQKIENFCKRNPDHDLCTGKNPGKSHATANY